MQTTLPDLPFTGYGDATTPIFHSSASASPRKYPRTDLKTLIPWTSFIDDVHQAIQSATALVELSSTPFTIGSPPRTRVVKSEEKLRAHAGFALHEPVEDVLKLLGVVGSFDEPGCGNPALIGDPDYSWIMSEEQRHPKLVVEYKTWWAADLIDLPSVFANTATRRTAISQQSLDALEQIYGYMTFNNTRFGILTNWKRAWFLRRAETPDRKTLEYFLVELNGSSPPISMLKAWVGMVLLSEDDWFYASPTLCSGPPARNFKHTKPDWQERKKAIHLAGDYHKQPSNGEYPPLALDFCLCRFDLSSSRHGAKGCVVNAHFLQPVTTKRDLDVVCKVVDFLSHPTAGTLLEGEARSYAALLHLQGQVIPTLYGFYEVWGILRLLAMEPVGEAISEGEEIDQNTLLKMKEALQRIHDAGYVHGDIARRNFCRTQSGDIFLVDLERCRRAEDQSELSDEWNEIEAL